MSMATSDCRSTRRFCGIPAPRPGSDDDAPRSTRVSSGGRRALPDPQRGATHAAAEWSSGCPAGATVSRIARMRRFCDLQVNGFAGVDFNDPALDDGRVREAARAMERTGVTRFLATLISAPLDRFSACARVLARSDRRRPRRHSHGRAVHLTRGRSARRAQPRRRADRLARRLRSAPGGGGRADQNRDRRAGSRRGAAAHRAARARRRAGRHRAHRRHTRSRSGTRSVRAPRFRRILATAAPRCCHAIRISSGSNWPPTS